MARKSHSNELENNLTTKSSSENGNSNGHSAKSKTKTSTNTDKEKTLDRLFHTVLKDAYSCEKQLVDALSEMAKAAYSEELQDGFKEHQKQTQRHVERIEKIFDRLRLDREEETCKVIETMVEVGNEIISKYDKSPLRDSALIIAAQKVEHFEIALYGSLIELADVLGYHKVIDLLERTLDEEKMTDEHLIDLAREINDEVVEMRGELQEY